MTILHTLAICVLLSAVSTFAAEKPKPVKVFILAGQSNMEGQGFIAADSKRNEDKGSHEYLVKSRAETYFLIGEAMGEAMKQRCRPKAKEK